MIPVGGASGVGVAGLLDAAEELAAELVSLLLVADDVGVSEVLVLVLLDVGVGSGVGVGVGFSLVLVGLGLGWAGAPSANSQDP